MSVAKILGNRLYLSALGVVLVLVVTVAYLFSSVLDIPITSRTKTVTVEMEATGGLFTGSAVTYRGVKVGKVRAITLGENGVRAKVALTSGDKIPRDTLAKVRSLSPVGEQYLDFQPRSNTGPYLEDGSVVPAASTDLPKTLAATVISLNKVLAQIDSDQLSTVLTELSVGLAGTGQDVSTMVSQGELLLGDLEKLWPETERLLVNTGTVADIAPDKANELRTLGKSAKQFAAFLKDYDPTLRQQLKESPEQISQLRALVKDVATLLPGWLKEAVNFSDLFVAHAPHLEALLSNYAPGLGVLAKAVSGGKLHITAIPQRDYRCEYANKRLSPRDTSKRPLNTGLHCPGSFPGIQRGAAHAPGPVR